MGKGSRPRPKQVSDEEYGLRYDIAIGKIKMSNVDFIKKIKEIRKRTGKP